MPTSSTVWCAPVSRSPLASTHRPSLPWRASRSSMWSRKPTPVCALASPPSRSSESSICVSAVLRCLFAVLLISGILLRSDRRRLAVQREPLRDGERLHVRCEFRRRPRRDLHGGDPAPEDVGAERPGKAPGASRRQHVVGAGDVVAEGGGAVRADEDA